MRSSSAWASSARRWPRRFGSSGSRCGRRAVSPSRSNGRSAARSARSSRSSIASTASSAFYGEGVEPFEGDARVERVVVTSAAARIECDFAVVGVGIEPVVDVVAGAGSRSTNGIARRRALPDERPGHLRGRRRRQPPCTRSSGGGSGSSTGATRSSTERPRRARMLGKGAPYAEVHWFWSDQYDANIQYAGHHRELGRARRAREHRRAQLRRVLSRRPVSSGPPSRSNSGRDLRRVAGGDPGATSVEPAKLRDPEIDLRTLVPGD